MLIDLLADKHRLDGFVNFGWFCEHLKLGDDKNHEINKQYEQVTLYLCTFWETSYFVQSASPCDQSPNVTNVANDGKPPSKYTT